MRRKKSSPLEVIIWISILVFLALVLTFPKWITFFYPKPHSEIVFAEAGKNNIDPYLVFAIMRTESKYQTAAESSAGARGLMQIMPDTAFWIAKQKGINNFDITSLYDPEVNIAFGCWYLADLSREYKGNLPLVIAAYNAGRGNVREWLNEGRWNGNLKELDKIPFPETRTYVRNVLKAYEAYKAIYEE
ncbi:soluble lytic murein transglycosylase [Thermosyntropha lipolytica DSM 11003]|uniref:Soluble lytic murein transglycosylase n=1 Tax=Thermosyntropha lipolytica DSM 11003 TaxID=1123382 RepID=A0A1M5MZC6_9FIRM|nr:lytic transglycosylase domain-containing protein [Thermosyntropha lipolytica]SHG82670.1 soluble lytic murein transglycosylase [Thermosyntropha lipolytica DSM 11003]